MSIFEQLANRDQVFEFLTPVASPVDVRHGPILYMEDVSVSFDGFKAINNLNLTTTTGRLTFSKQFTINDALANGDQRLA